MSITVNLCRDVLFHFLSFHIIYKFCYIFFLNWRLLQNEAEVDKIAQFMQIYRSREVGQSYFTSVWTTLIATLHALWLMIKIRPQVVFILSINLQNYMTTFPFREPIVVCVFFDQFCFVADSMQWPWYLYPIMLNCIHIQGSIVHWNAFFCLFISMIILFVEDNTEWNLNAGSRN